ncbi:hypothetical protein HYW21_09240 [Candidatus Woesearchaeota archaeon]|nr:hypothetical protein [Candidatus Woesearchaeota archaeon]
MNPNLEMKVSKTQAGLYTVTYGYKEAPLDVQEAAFAVHGMHMVSPAELGFLRVQGPKDTFNPYSRTNADVFYDDRTNQVVIVPDGAISNLVGIPNLVEAHKQGRECVLPNNQRDSVYGIVDEMLGKGTAFTANHGQTDILVSEFGQFELTSRLFSDESLRIKAQDYGDWLKEQGRGSQSMVFGNKDYAKFQGGPYVNRLRVFGPDFGVNVDGDVRFLDCNDGGAFGVRFEKTAGGGAKK